MLSKKETEILEQRELAATARQRLPPQNKNYSKRGTKAGVIYLILNTYHCQGDFFSDGPGVTPDFNTKQAQEIFFSKVVFLAMDYEFPHRTQRSRRNIFFDIFCHTKKYCGPGFFPRRNLMKLFFPNQKRQQIALAKNQDGARGDDLPNQHKTGTLDCPRRNFAKLFFQSHRALQP